MDGEADLEDGGDAEASLAAPENQTGPQVTRLRGNDPDREAEMVETVLLQVAVEPMPDRRRAPFIDDENVRSTTGIAEPKSRPSAASSLSRRGVSRSFTAPRRPAVTGRAPFGL